MSPTTRTPRTPTTATRTGRVLPKEFIAILCGRNDDGDVVAILQENTDYIYVFKENGSPIDRPLRTQQSPRGTANRTKRVPII